MKLKNFDISRMDIILTSGSLSWDLHNFADFQGLELISASNSAVMKWTVRGTTNPNPWGCFENKASGMELHFYNLTSLSVTPRDAELPLTEDSCVSAVIKVDRNLQREDPYMRTRRDWRTDESFRLMFLFQGGRTIEIESESAELIPIV
jgi:hypothetical protein